MKKLTLVAVFIAFAVTANGQFKGVEINFNSNILIIPTKTKSNNVNISPVSVTGYADQSANIGTIEETFKSSIGFGLNVLPVFQLNDRLKISFGLGSSYIAYDRDVNVYAIGQTNTLLVENWSNTNDNGGSGILFGEFATNEDGDIIIIDNGSNSSSDIGEPRNGETKLFFISLPVRINYQIKKRWDVGGSISYSKLVIARENGSVFGYNQQASSLELYEVVHKDTTPFKNSQFSIGLMTSYLIWNNISISASFEHALTNLYQEDYQYGGKAKFNNISLGISYRFLKKSVIE